MGFPIVAVFAIILFSGCLQNPADTNANQGSGPGAEGTECRSDNECQSGVCDFIKQDFGSCAPVVCVKGTQAQGLSDISFFCNENREWEQIKAIGENCTSDFECFKRTGKDCPTCHPEDFEYYCKNNVCVEEYRKNACEQQGLK
ncbi:MAG: hypothetical protein HY917_00900, partial [Candidatus Diapherotrites archaeon]|nr:hypothetical protein [Candidatus Diapherotrites archaeon]